MNVPLTGAKVKEAVNLMKSGKSDVSGAFTSEAIIHAPDILYDQIAMIFRSWLTHGTVTKSLLACVFMPLMKNALKNSVGTSSYRAKAGSSLFLELLFLTLSCIIT